MKLLEKIIIKSRLKLVKVFKKIKFSYLSTRYLKINKIFTHLTFEEKLILLDISKNIEGCFVEIGSYLGASSCFISEGIIRSKSPRSKIYCVDTWQNDAMLEDKQDTFPIFLKNTKRYKKVLVPLRGKSVEIADKFSEKIDFIFFDADHSYEGIKSDVEAWFPKLNTGAVVVFHDIGWAEGVQRVIKEVVSSRVKEEHNLSNMFWATLK